MDTNPTIDLMLRRASIRTYKPEAPPDGVVEAVVRAGQQAPFAAQMGSIILSRDAGRNAFGAPLLFTICVDAHRLEAIIERRGWRVKSSDLSILLFGIQDACYMAENMVIAAESLGLGSCFLGGAPYRADEIAAAYSLPPRVFPIVQLAMGYPAEDPPPRPRYPLTFTLFEDGYPEFTDGEVEAAMAVMDEGYLAQGYYRKAKYMVPLEEGRNETYAYDTYGWTEHMGRKWGQWHASPAGLLDQLAKRGFRIAPGGCDGSA